MCSLPPLPEQRTLCLSLDQRVLGGGARSGNGDACVRSPVWVILTTVLALGFSIGTKTCCSEGASVAEGIYQCGMLITS
ncbi:hypothetical protein VPH35_126365 [Triticum aestivum]